VEVQPLDYNKQGMAIDTPTELQPEEDVMVALELVMDMGSIQIEKLAGVVRYVLPIGSQFRYGIEFDFQGPRFMRSPENEAQLARIETLLQRSLNVQDRIRSQKGLSMRYGFPAAGHWPAARPLPANQSRLFDSQQLMHLQGQPPARVGQAIL